MKLDFLKRFEFFAGVPDSLLAPVCSYLISTYGIGKQHIIAANEGNAVALAAGYHLATGRIPVVYMQNSGKRWIWLWRWRRIVIACRLLRLRHLLAHEQI